MKSPHTHSERHAFVSLNGRAREGLTVVSRRGMLKAGLAGMAGLSLPDLLRVRAEAAASGRAMSRGKSVILLWMAGGPSHVDLFDPKPLLTKLDGKPIPDSIEKPKQTSRGTGNNALMASRRTWKQYGQSGMWVSDWYKNIGPHVDDMTIIRSCWAAGIGLG